MAQNAIPSAKMCPYDPNVQQAASASAGARYGGPKGNLDSVVAELNQSREITHNIRGRRSQKSSTESRPRCSRPTTGNQTSARSASTILCAPN
jgi:hypothetical protein